MTMAGHWFGRITVALLALGSTLATGCETMRENRNAATGAGVGGLIGAGVGTVGGAATGNPRTGAAVGAALGAGTGAAIGAEADYDERERKDAVRLAEAEAAIANGPGPNGPVGMTDVVQMANAQPPVSDEVIISYLRKNGGSFNLSPSDIAYLKQNRVSDRVVNEMINCRPPQAGVRPGPRTVVVREPYVPPPVVVYERPYYWGPHCWGPRPVYVAPPPPTFGVGVMIRK
jgi:hypothetical protein